MKNRVVRCLHGNHSGDVSLAASALIQAPTRFCCFLAVTPPGPFHLSDSNSFSYSSTIRRMSNSASISAHAILPECRALSIPSQIRSCATYLSSSPYVPNRGSLCICRWPGSTRYDGTRLHFSRTRIPVPATFWLVPGTSCWHHLQHKGCLYVNVFKQRGDG
jgi:hypothetical protein